MSPRGSWRSASPPAIASRSGHRTAPRSSMAALAVYRCGAVLVPISTRYKGDEAADLLRRSGAVALLTVTDFGNFDPLALLDAAGALPSLRTTIVLAGPVPDDALSADSGSLARAGADDMATMLEREASIRPDERAATSSSRRARRPSEGGDAAPWSQRSRPTNSGATGRSPRRRPLPRRVPDVPHVRIEVGHPRVPPPWRSDPSASGVRRAGDDAACRRRADHDAARPTDGVPDPARPPRARHVRPVERPQFGDRRCGRARGDHPQDARRPPHRRRRHRLRAHRNDRNGERVSLRRHRRDRRHDRRPSTRRCRGPRRRR